MRSPRKPTQSLVLAILALLGLYYFLSSTSSLQDPQPLSPQATVTATDDTTSIQQNNHNEINQFNANSVDVVKESTPFMPKMTNETLKAELGNAAWKLFHTILARYPETPTQQERDTLTQYIYLFAQVYPCGDCARHFDQLLKKFPPQTSSRQVAAVWGCHVHNQVNERLGHPLYDCTHIIEDYDCGCGEDELAEGGVVGSVDDVNIGKVPLLDQDHLQFDLETEDKQLG